MTCNPELLCCCWCGCMNPVDECPGVCGLCKEADHHLVIFCEECS